MPQQETFHSLLNDNPVIAAVKNREGLARALESEAHVVFTLFGTITDIAEITAQVKQAGKLCMVHIDLIDGLAPREASVEYIAAFTKADGVISTKQLLIKAAAAKGLLTVQRFFLIDSMAIENIRKQKVGAASAIEVLPGLMPKIITQVSGSVSVPVIAGGLISEKEDVLSALSAGAWAVSTTNPAMWFL